MIVNHASLEALQVRRDRFHLMFAALYDGRVDGYGASLVLGTASLVGNRLHLGVTAPEERGPASSDAQLVTMHCARTEPHLTHAWSFRDRHDQKRIRSAASSLAGRAAMRAKMLLATGEGDLAREPAVSRALPLAHLDVLSMPNGRACLVGFGPLPTSLLSEGAWLVARAEMGGRALVLTERAVNVTDGEVWERTIARVEGCDRILLDLVMSHRFIDLVVFRQEVSAEGSITERDFEVLQFRTMAWDDGEQEGLDPETAALIDRMFSGDIDDAEIVTA